MRICIEMDPRQSRRARRVAGFGVLALAVACPTWLAASQVGPLVTFAPGETIRSADFNQNFQAVASAIDDTDSKLTTLSGQVAPLPNEIGALQAQSATLQSQNAQLQSQNANLQAQVVALQTSLRAITLQGTLDPTWNGTGTSSPGGLGTAYGAALDSAGRVVTVGHDFVSGELTVRRYETNGQADPTFGTGGVTLSAGSGAPAFGYGIVIDASGRILVAGLSGTTQTMTLWRFTASGVPDSTFGGAAGFVTDLAGATSSKGAGLALDANGNVVVAGQSVNAGTTEMSLWRFTPAGALDTTFAPGNTGSLSTAGTGTGAEASRVVLDAAGNIVVAGSTYPAASSSMIVWRFTPAGVLDTTFDAAGPTPGLLTSAGAGAPAVGYGLALDSSHRIVVVGGSTVAGVLDPTVWRLATDGSIDPTIPGGFASNVGGGGGVNSYLYAVTFDATGRILASGSSNNVGLVLERLNATGALDPTFGSGGVATAPRAGHATAVLIDAQGRVVVPGEVGGPSEAVFRFE